MYYHLFDTMQASTGNNAQQRNPAEKYEARENGIEQQNGSS